MRDSQLPRKRPAKRDTGNDGGGSPGSRTGNEAGSPVRALGIEPEKISANQQAAQSDQAFGRFGRFLFGAIAAILGALLLLGVLWSPFTLVPRYGLAGSVATSYLFVWAAATLVSFAAGQMLQLFFVGGDEGYDPRLWARLTPLQRGDWKVRTGVGAVTAWRLFLWICIALTVYVDLRLVLPLWRAGNAGPAVLVVLAFNLAACGLVALATRVRMPRVPRPRAGAWVSEGRWVVVERDDPRDGANLHILWGGMCVACAGIAVMEQWPKVGPVVVQKELIAFGVAWMLFGACRRFWLRHAQVKERRLEIVRATDVPLVLLCRASLPLHADEVAGEDWLARFAAYKGWARLPRDADKEYARWIDVPSRPHVAAGAGHSLEFTFALEIPHEVQQRTQWKIRLERTRSGKPAFEFTLPEQVVFPEEFPAV